MGFSLSRRRRNFLLICAALAAGGYASYKLYNLPIVVQKRRRVMLFLGSLARMAECMSESIDCTAIVASDLKTFLLSDEDNSPQSLRQSLKIVKLPEFQEALVCFSSCIFQGLINGVQNNKRLDISSGNVRVDEAYKTQVLHSQAGEGIAKLRPVDDQKHEHIDSQNVSRGKNQASEENGGIPERLMQKLFTDAGTGFASTVLGSVARNIVLSYLENKRRYEFSRNFTESSDSNWESPLIAEFELKTAAGQDGYLGSSLGSSGWTGKFPLDGLELKDPWSPNNLLDLACSKKGRLLVAECIQAFVGTAVSVYLDKTKDVNVYEDIVASITKPSHEASVKELLTSVCSGVVETMVRTTHEVLSTGAADLGQDFEQKQEPCSSFQGQESDLTVETGKQSEITGSNISVDGSMSSKEDLDSFLTSERDSGSTSYGGDSSDSPCLPQESDYGKLVRRESWSTLHNSKALIPHVSSQVNFPNWIENLSKTLAVPSNRKLVMELAGTVTSEAVHSSFDAVLNIFRPSGGRKRGEEQSMEQLLSTHRSERHVMSSQSLADVDGKYQPVTQRVAELTRNMVARSLVATTVCLVIILHVLVGIKLFEPI